MQIIATGVLSRGVPATDRAALTFPTAIVLANGELLATLRAGSSKDSADERIDLWRSRDDGHSWHGPEPCPPAPVIGGAAGTLKLCYLTEIAPRTLIAAAMWVDRSTHPGQPLFNPATEGCLPMAIVLSTSADAGVSWSPWRVVPLPAELGPPSLTSPLLRLADGALAMSIETNKAYDDAGPWQQRAVLLHSTDGGQQWGTAIVAAQDPHGRIFNWDLRLGVAPDGRIGSFAWTYDSATKRYVNIHRRISADNGRTWTPPEALDFADQAGRPAIFPDGSVILPWVDRFGTRSIRARRAPAVDAPFDPISEVTLFSLDANAPAAAATTGDLLAEMALWTFGLPYATPLPASDALVLYYAGSPSAMDIHWARLGEARKNV
jgi:hypothetical protein